MCASIDLYHPSWKVSSRLYRTAELMNRDAFLYEQIKRLSFMDLKGEQLLLLVQ